MNCEAALVRAIKNSLGTDDIAPAISELLAHSPSKETLRDAVEQTLESEDLHSANIPAKGYLGHATFCATDYKPSDARCYLLVILGSSLYLSFRKRGEWNEGVDLSLVSAAVYSLCRIRKPELLAIKLAEFWSSLNKILPDRVLVTIKAIAYSIATRDSLGLFEPIRDGPLDVPFAKVKMIEYRFGVIAAGSGRFARVVTEAMDHLDPAIETALSGD